MGLFEVQSFTNFVNHVDFQTFCEEIVMTFSYVVVIKACIVIILENISMKVITIPSTKFLKINPL